MKCSLIKSTKTIEKEGKSYVNTTFRLVFDNGVSVIVVPAYYPTSNIKDLDKVEKIKAFNRNNATKLNILADLEEGN